MSSKMTEEDQNKTVNIKQFGSHATVSLPNGSWVEYEYSTGDMMCWDSRKRKNFSSLMSTEEAE